MVAGVVPFLVLPATAMSAETRRLPGLPGPGRLALVHYRRPFASCSNRWSAAYTRSIRTMVIRFSSTSYSTR